MANLPQSGGALSIATFDAMLYEGGGTCDLRRQGFIDAYGLVATACALRSAGVNEPDALLLPEAVNARRHLVTMGLADFLATIGVDADWQAEPRIAPEDIVVPLQSAADSGAAQALSNLLWEQLRDHVSPQVLNAIGEGVSEMIANALEHSGTDAIVMGQVYRAPRGKPPDHDDRVQLVIGDIGRGIRESFLATATYTPASDRDAVLLALEYLVTSVENDPGRGQGLSTTMDLVLETQGSMVVRSGTAKISITESGRAEASVPFLPGVLVALNLPLYPG